MYAVFRWVASILVGCLTGIAAGVAEMRYGSPTPGLLAVIIGILVGLWFFWAARDD